MSVNVDNFEASCTLGLAVFCATIVFVFVAANLLRKVPPHAIVLIVLATAVLGAYYLVYIQSRSNKKITKRAVILILTASLAIALGIFQACNGFDLSHFSDNFVLRDRL
jgi:uncharacterized membrane protein YfcA